MFDGKIVVLDRESYRDKASAVRGVFGGTLLTNDNVPTEVVKAVMNALKAYCDGLEIALFGSKEETDDKAAETATKEDK
jgi:hypothetical protein